MHPLRPKLPSQTLRNRPNRPFPTRKAREVRAPLDTRGRAREQQRRRVLRLAHALEEQRQHCLGEQERAPPARFVAAEELLGRELEEGLADEAADAVHDGGRDDRLGAVGAERVDRVEGGADVGFSRDVRGDAEGLAAVGFDLIGDGLVTCWGAGEEDDGVPGGGLIMGFRGQRAIGKSRSLERGATSHTS